MTKVNLDDMTLLNQRMLTSSSSRIDDFSLEGWLKNDPVLTNKC